MARLYNDHNTLSPANTPNARNRDLVSCCNFIDKMPPHAALPVLSGESVRLSAGQLKTNSPGFQEDAGGGPGDSLFSGYDSFPHSARTGLVGMAFNLGITWLRNEFTKINAAVNQLDWNEAASESHRTGIRE